MSKKFIILVVFLLVVILTLVFVFSGEYQISQSGDVKTLHVSTEGPIELSAIIDDIETGTYYEGYNTETLNWMKSLGDKSVFSGDGYFVVMSDYDAGKLHSEYILDAYITQEFKCSVLENHSLGNVKYSRDILLVDDVEYLGENITYLQGS